MFLGASSFENAIKRVIQLQNDAPKVAKRFKRARMYRERILRGWAQSIQQRLYNFDDLGLRAYVEEFGRMQSLQAIDQELERLLDVLQQRLEERHREHERDTVRRLNNCLLEAGKIYLKGHYQVAVFEAFKTVEVAVRRLSGLPETAYGDKLVVDAMNPPSPKIKFSNTNGEQERACYLYRGALGFIRNPRGHRFIETERWEALEYLVFASMLLNGLDRHSL